MTEIKLLFFKLESFYIIKSFKRFESQLLIKLISIRVIIIFCLKHIYEMKMYKLSIFHNEILTFHLCDIWNFFLNDLYNNILYLTDIIIVFFSIIRKFLLLQILKYFLTHLLSKTILEFFLFISFKSKFITFYLSSDLFV